MSHRVLLLRSCQKAGKRSGMINTASGSLSTVRNVHVPYMCDTILTAYSYTVYTKKSQWDKPTEPVYPPGEAPPDHPPPSYIPGAAGGLTGAHSTAPSEKAGFGSNNPYANISEDEKLARKLQDEEEARARSHGPGAGASNDYYGQPGQAQPGQYGSGYPQQSAAPYGQTQPPIHDSQAQDKGKSKGFLGKLLGKAQGHGSSSSHGYPQQAHYGQPQPVYGAPMAGGQYYQQPMMGGGMGGMGGRRPGGGMGAGGAMALGAGGGLLGGMVLGEALGDAGDGGDGGGDYGGDGGGDFGGDGGGDFGGGGDF